jgi:glycogen debranching enzyme
MAKPIEEIIQVEDQYYILATSSRADDRTRVIKHGETFAVFDRAGAIRAVGPGELGLFHHGTRFLSGFDVLLERRRLQPLRSTVRRDNALLVDLTNSDLPDVPDGGLSRDTVHVLLSSVLWDGAWYARVVLHNYGQRTLDLHLGILFAADFADIFEVRGIRRARRGVMLAPEIAGPIAVLGYTGLDGVTRKTRLELAVPSAEHDGAPTLLELTAAAAAFRIELPPNGERAIDLAVTCAIGPGDPAPSIGFAAALDRSRCALADLSATTATIETSNPRLDEWIDRSACDLRMMTTRTPHGPYPYAGVPWFSTVFGRDGLWTAFETLWLDPSLTAGVLSLLAATQATTHDAERDAEPGKILHELRTGEMAALGEVPFGRYYGSVDATPLFVALLGAYWRRTGDRALVEALWPNALRALAWIDDHGDLDRDGFVEYARRSPTGLTSQGWKDSADAISHAGGELAEGPIAVAEVQAYVYAAKRAAARIARVLGDPAHADALEREAIDLRDRFQRAFWCDAIGTYALALDGAKRPCQVRASNAGHCLLAGIASGHHAEMVGQTLLDEHSFSGWGIRTLDSREIRYNPMSYHNGSVWPHDNVIAAAGMARYGRKDRALRVFTALYDASVHFDLHRMPELFCGFRQRLHEGPTLYPVACAPQSWAAGAVFLLLQACLGIAIDAPAGTIELVRPALPDAVRRIAIRKLALGTRGRTDLIVERHDRHVSCHVEHCEGDVKVLVVKR